MCSNPKPSSDVHFEIEKTQNELTKLKLEYSLLLRELNSSASHDGDLAENGDWISSQEKKETLLQKISIEEEKIKSLKEGAKKQEVTYLILKTGEKKTIHLTSHWWESDPEKGYITYASLLGSVLSSQKEGSVVAVTTPQGTYEIQILNKSK